MPEGYAQFLRRDGLAIFLFHGVVDGFSSPVRNYTSKHLQKNVFADVLSDLTAHGRAVSMDDVVAHWTRGVPMPENAFAVSFDDGFANNLHVAAPVLADFDVPAVFYMTTDFVDSNAMSWIDRIELAVEGARKAEVRLPWGSRAIRDPEEKRGVLEEIRTEVKSSPAIDPTRLADAVQEDLLGERVVSSDDPLNRKLSWSEVSALAGSSLFTVGGHSHTHAILSFLDDEELEFEIDTSLTLLRENTGVETVHYSYPEGLRHCYDDRVIAALKARGIVCSPSAEPGTNDAAIDLFRLKRIPVASTVPDRTLIAEVAACAA